MRKKFAGCVLANKPGALIRLRLCGSWPGIFTTPSLISIHTIIHIGHNDHICQEYMELHAGKIYTHRSVVQMHSVIICRAVCFFTSWCGKLG